MSKCCKPEVGEYYWFLNSKFEPAMDVYNDRTVDHHRYCIGNRFNTEGEAIAASKKVKKLLSTLRTVKTNNQLPKLTVDVFDLPDCPEWAKWAAVDRDRKACFYSRKPKCDNMQMWLPGGVAVEFKTIRGSKFDAFEWQNSLIERPKTHAERIK